MLALSFALMTRKVMGRLMLITSPEAQERLMVA
jgi:hypothetical protein